MFRKLRDYTQTAYPLGDLIEYGFDDNSPFNTIEELTNTDLFNTTTLNRTIKNLYENDDDISKYFNAYLNNNLINGSGIINTSTTRNFKFEEKDIISSRGADCYIDKTTLGSVSYNYLRLPTGVLLIKNGNTNNKIICVKPQLNVLERQIKNAIGLNLVKEINRKIIEEVVEIKYSEESTLFMCKIIKILDTENYITLYFGSNETNWNNDDFSSSSFETSFDLILAINNYTDSDINFRGDLYIACQGNFELFRGEQLFILDENNYIYYDLIDKEFKNAVSASGFIDISIPIAFINGINIKDNRFLFNNTTNASLQRMPVVDVSVPVEPITLSNYSSVNILNIGSNENFTIESQYYLYEDFFTDSNKKGFIGTIPNSSILDITGDTISTDISINFNLKATPANGTIIRGYNGATIIFSLQTQIIDGNTFSCNFLSSSYIKNAYAICDGELVGCENITIKSIPVNIDIGNHFYIVLSLTDAVTRLQFESSNNSRQFTNIKIYNNENIANSDEFYKIINNEIQGLMSIGTKQLISKNEYMGKVKAKIAHLQNEGGAIVNRAISGEDNRFGLIVRENGKNLSISSGNYVNTDFENQRIDFTNETNIIDKINYEERSVPPESWVSVKNSADGKYVIACCGSIDLNDSVIGKIYVSNDYGATYTQVVSPVDKSFKKVFCDSSGKFMAACAYNDYVYTSIDYGVTWGTTSIQDNWADVYIIDGGITFIACAYNGYIYTSEDQGVTWNNRTNSLGVKEFKILAGNRTETLYAATEDEYIYYSQNKGIDWTAITTKSETWQSITTTNDSTLYTIYSNTINITKDFGTTWIEYNSSLLPSIINCSNNGKYIIINSTDTTLCNNFYISRNYGKTFEPISCIGTRDWSSFSISDNGDFIIAAETTSSGLFLSKDNGYDFQEVSYVTNPQLKSGQVALNNNGDIVFSAGFDIIGYFDINYQRNLKQGIFFNGNSNIPCEDEWTFDGSSSYEKMVATSVNNNYIYRTSDYGETWIKSTSEAKSFISMASSADGAVIIAVTGLAGEYIYRSIDSGATWTELSYPGTGTWTKCATNSTGSYLYAYDYANGFLWRYSSSAWNVAKIFEVAGNPAYLYALSCSSTGTSVLTCTDQSGRRVLFSVNNGVTFSTYSQIPYIASRGYEVYIAKASNYAIAISENTAYYINGTTGFDQEGTDKQVLIDTGGLEFNTGGISPDGKRIILGNKYNNNIYISAPSFDFNSYTSSTPVPFIKYLPEKNKNFNKIITSADGTIIYGTTNIGYIYRSVDSGNNWKQIRNAGTRSWQDIGCSTDGTFVLAISDNIYISRDGGEYWTFVGLENDNFKQLDMSPSGQHIVVISQTSLFISHDYGFNWTTREVTGYASNNYSCSISDDGEVIYYLSETKGNTVP